MRKRLLTFAACLLSGGPALAQGASAMQAPMRMQGQDTPYVDPASLPDAVAILPTPPAAGSPQQTADLATFEATRALKGTPRWALATRDADLSATHLADDFSCAVGVRLTPASVPSLFRIMDRSKADAAAVYSKPKARYQRVRPFVGNDAPICVPRDAKLAGNGSFPSGHATIGDGLALILAEAAPAHATAILARGRVFGESRVVCGVHWATDVEAGFLTASTLVASLHGSADFRADESALAGEIARANGAPDATECAVEAQAAAKPVLMQ
jgi:acid phosphatase (class A)